MMSLGIWGAILAAVLAGTANTYMKYVSGRVKNGYIALVPQYISISIFASVFVFFISGYQGVDFFPSLDLASWGVLLIVGIVGYAGIYFLFRAFETISGGIVLMIANSAVFMMYFVNLYLFQGAEFLPVLQLIIGVLFFIVIANFLWEQSDHRIKFNTDMLYPLGTAVCWTVFFVGNTWFVKNNIMTPVQSVFATETIILVFAVLGYLIMFGGSFQPLQKSWDKSLFIPFFMIGLTLVASNFLFYYGYLDNPANIINFIRLFGVIVVAILSWKFLGDVLTRKQFVLMSLALLLLILFIFADQLLALV